MTIQTLLRRKPKVEVDATVWWAVWFDENDESHRLSFDSPGKANAHLTENDYTDAWLEMELVTYHL